MLDMGFMPDLKRILAMIPKQRQSLLFSATFSEPIRALAQDFLRDPITVEVARRNQTNENVRQVIMAVDDRRRRQLLSDLLRTKPWEQALVFVNRKVEAIASATSCIATATPSSRFTAIRIRSSATVPLPRLRLARRA